MNEELKIIIRAVTAEAKKNLANVREELEKVEQTAGDTGSAVNKALSSIRKGALVAIGSITALTTAMVTLGKRAVEFQKIQGQLVSGFNSVGLSADQASSVYKKLYGFLGQSDTAAEAANLLAQLTQEEANLTEWTEILQGVYATFPDSIPIESLAEAINHTAQLGEVQGTLADALEWVGVSTESFNNTLATTNSVAEREAIIRSTLNSLYSSASSAYSQANASLIAYNQSQAELESALASVANYLTPLMTSMNNLATTLLSTLKPAFETVAAIVIVFVQWIIAAIEAVSSFFGIFSSSGASAVSDVADSVGQVVKSSGAAVEGIGGVTGAIEDASAAAAEFKRQTMGFDELNVMSSTSTSSGSSGSGSGIGSSGIDTSGIEIPDLTESLDLGVVDEFKEKIEQVKNYLSSIAPLVLTIAGALALWKIVDFVTDLISAVKYIPILDDMISLVDADYDTTALKETRKELQSVIDKVKTWTGLLLIVGGAISLVKGFSDAWLNGLDWGNFAMILGGIAAIVGGIALAFGPVAASIALVVGGIVALVIGIKDLITNGYSLEGVLMVAAGAIAVIIGVVWAFNAALLANPITWIVVGITALVAILVILWNECEGFRNFWIGVWEMIKAAFAAFVESCQPLFDAIGNAFKELWGVIEAVWTHITYIFEAAWEFIKSVWDAVEPYFMFLWEAIKAIFSVVADVLGGFFGGAWEIIKTIWSVVIDFFAAIWNTIAGIFSVVKNVLSGNFKGAWDAIKGIWNTVTGFFSGIWDGIKKVFSVVGTWFKDIFKGAWNGIKSVFSSVGDFFTGIWNKIKSIFSKVGSAIADAVSGAFKSAINWVLEKAIGIINGFISAINFAIKVINLIPGVELDYLEKLSVPQLAKGGITTGATLAQIGERGREAVLPLENNTGWMDILADRIASRNQTPSKIVLKVDGRELGWASINNINDITKQTGGLQLHVV